MIAHSLANQSPNEYGSQAFLCGPVVGSKMFGLIFSKAIEHK
jgi:hypothetical protein